MLFKDFKNQFNNVSNVGNTLENIGQCTGLVEVWINAIGGPHIWGDAKDLYANAPLDSFIQIPNSPTAIPIEGDVVCWASGFNGGAGHTGIATGKADVNNFDCFEQNDPIGSTPHIKTYNYAYVVGWLRPKTAIVDSVSVPKQDFENLVTKSTNCDVVAGYTKLDSLDKQFGNIVVAKFEDLTKQLATCQAKVNTSTPPPTTTGQETVSVVHSPPADSTGGGNGNSSTSVGSVPVAPTPPDPQVQTPSKNFLQRVFKLLLGLVGK